jgi:hypothetical protein
MAIQQKLPATQLLVGSPIPALNETAERLAISTVAVVLLLTRLPTTEYAELANGAGKVIEALVAPTVDVPHWCRIVPMSKYPLAD